MTRTMLLAVLLLNLDLASAESLYRWTDRDGRVHYGDVPPREAPLTQQAFEVPDNYDEQAHADAERRNRELEEWWDREVAERAADEKRQQQEEERAQRELEASHRREDAARARRSAARRDRYAEIERRNREIHIVRPRR